jgi:peptide/nickel transport system permease protein
MLTVGADLAGWGLTVDVLRHMVLPTVTLALFYLALYTRLMRASMLEVYGQDYVTHRAREGRRRIARCVPPRAAQRAAADGDDARACRSGSLLGGGAHRGGVQLARSRPAAFDSVFQPEQSRWCSG